MDIHLLIPDELLDKIDEARGRESRSSFIRWAVEQAMLLRRPMSEVARDAEQALGGNADRSGVPEAPPRADGSPSAALAPAEQPCGCVGGNCMAGAGGLLPGQFCRHLPVSPAEQSDAPDVPDERPSGRREPHPNSQLAHLRRQGLA